MTKRAVVVPIDKARPASSASLGEGVLEHLDGLYRFALRLTQDVQLAQELVQESAVRALEEGEGVIRDPRAWLFQTLYHLFVSHYRRRLGQGSANEEPFDEDSSPESVSRPLSNPIILEDVRRAVEALPQELRTVVWLSDAEQFRLREIAEMLEWPLGTVASRLWRARRELRRYLSAYGPPREKQA